MQPFLLALALLAPSAPVNSPAAAPSLQLGPGRAQAVPAPPPESMPVVPAPEVRRFLEPRCPATPGSACTSPLDGMPILNHPHPGPIVGPRPSCLPEPLRPPRPWFSIIPVSPPPAAPR